MDAYNPLCGVLPTQGKDPLWAEDRNRYVGSGTHNEGQEFSKLSARASAEIEPVARLVRIKRVSERGLSSDLASAPAHATMGARRIH
jgi:hypothetical protein